MLIPYLNMIISCHVISSRSANLESETWPVLQEVVWESLPGTWSCAFWTISGTPSLGEGFASTYTNMLHLRLPKIVVSKLAVWRSCLVGRNFSLTKLGNMWWESPACPPADFIDEVVLIYFAQFGLSIVIDNLNHLISLKSQVFADSCPAYDWGPQ